MNEHVTRWLEAYYDGELSDRRSKQVEAHLDTCKSCHDELDSLNSLSILLQELPEASNLASADSFAAQVGLRLPRRSFSSSRQKVIHIGWQWLPVVILSAWVFVQTTFFVSGVLRWILQIVPGLDKFASMVQNDSQSLGFFGEISNLTGAGFSEIGSFGLDLFGSGGPLGWAVTLNLGLTIIIGLLYLSWLASWWVQKSNGN